MNPFKILELDTTASPSDVKKQYKKLLFKHHPDHGGTLCGFLYLNEAYEKAMKVAKDTKCTECDGGGIIYKAKGFRTLQTPCKLCKGSGKMYGSN